MPNGIDDIIDISLGSGTYQCHGPTLLVTCCAARNPRYGVVLLSFNGGDELSGGVPCRIVWTGRAGNSDEDAMHFGRPCWHRSHHSLMLYRSEQELEA